MKNSDRSLIVSRFCAAYDALENTGGMLHTVCDAVVKAFGNEMPDDDAIKTIQTDMVKARGWKGDSIAARSSEVGIIVKAATQNLASAISTLHKKGKRDWHTTMKAARKLAKGESVATAVQYALDNSQGEGEGKGKGKGKGGNPQGRVAGALKALYDESRGERRAAVLKALRALQTKFNIRADWAK